MAAGAQLRLKGVDYSSRSPSQTGLTASLARMGHSGLIASNQVTKRRALRQLADIDYDTAC